MAYLLTPSIDLSMTKVRSLLIAYSTCLCLSLQAIDLGTYGQLFEVKEINLLDYLKQKTQSLSTKELDKLFANVRPKFVAVKNLKNANVYRKFYFDPTVCAQENILNHQNQVVVAKGQCANPLDYTSLMQDLLFLDGTNSAHIQWAKTQSKDAQWILVNGNPLALEEQEQRAIYFDQQGILATKLDLTFLPAKVSQDHKQLQIEEFPVKETQ